MYVGYRGMGEEMPISEEKQRSSVAEEIGDLFGDAENGP